MSRFLTEQENFWAGEFGTEYILRNRGNLLQASNINLFAMALGGSRNIKTCIGFGANIGMNLKALKILYPSQEQYGIEINVEAAKQLAQFVPPENVYNDSILEFQADRTWDLVLIKGVLIHINQEVLPQIYKKLVAATARYLLVTEYYNPSPVTVPYRGNTERLFKRDFAGEIMDAYPQMQLIDYGFIYRRDPSFPQDDLTWFLLKKEE